MGSKCLIVEIFAKRWCLRTNYSDIVASKMTPAQVAEAQMLAREWKPKKDR